MLIIIIGAQLFIIAAVLFVVTMGIAGAFDLSISNTFINYGSIFGTIFQNFGELPVYLIFYLAGQVVISYGVRMKHNRLFSAALIAGGIGLSVWQLNEYLKEVISYISESINNINSGKPMGVANSDSSNEVSTFLVLVIVYVILTILCQFWLKSKSGEELKKLVIISIFASLTVWFAYQANGLLKNLWGRVRPYELSAAQTEFTNWLTINGPNGHRSFPSGHTMAGTLMIVFAWFMKGNMRRNFWIFGIVYGVLMGISRVIIGAHYFSDVMFSFFLTSLIIYIMWEIYRHVIDEKDQLDPKNINVDE